MLSSELVDVLHVLVEKPNAAKGWNKSIIAPSCMNA
jgi:hypothetical protein